jgi:hypothetical protein
MEVKNCLADLVLNNLRKDEEKDITISIVGSLFTHLYLDLSSLLEFQSLGKTFVQNANFELRKLLRELIEANFAFNPKASEHDASFRIEILKGEIVLDSNKLFLHHASIVLQGVKTITSRI